MQNKEDHLYVKYGDFIILHVETLQGNVATQGFSNRNLYLQYVPQNHSDCFTRNKREMRFQVYPKLVYDAHRDYNSSLDFFKQQFEIDEEPVIEDEVVEEQEKQEENTQEKKETKEGNENDFAEGANDNDGNAPAQDETNQEALNQDQNNENAEEADVNDGHFYAQLQRNKQKTNNMNAQMKRDMNDFKKKLMLLERKVKEEDLENSTKVSFNYGQIIEYGNCIQLLHVDSDCFVEASTIPAEEDNSAFKVQLSHESSVNNHFLALGGFRYKQKGDRIHYNDQILLKHEQTNQYLHVTERFIKIEALDGIVPQIYIKGVNEITPKVIDRRDPPNQYVPFMEVNASNVKTKFHIMVFRYSDEDVDEQFIKGGMVVRLMHTEKGGFIHSDNKDFTSSGLAEVYLWNFKGKPTEMEAMSSASLFEIEVANPYDIKPLSTQNQNNEPKQSQTKRQDVSKRWGQVFNYSTVMEENTSFSKNKDNVYRLRHLSTGRLIIDQEILYDGIKIRTLGLAPHCGIKNIAEYSDKGFGPIQKQVTAIDEESKFQINTDVQIAPQDYAELDRRSRFRILSTNPSMDSRIKSNSCVQIQHVASEMYLSLNETTAAFVPKKDQSMLRDNQGELFFPVDDEDIQSGTNQAIELRVSRSNEDAFFILPESDQMLNSIFFIQTSIDQLKKYLPTICSKNLEISKEKQSRIMEVLNSIYSFLLGDTVPRIQDTEEHSLPKGFSKEENDQYQQRQSNLNMRQKLMRELYIVESLVHVIYLPFEHGEWNLQSVRQNDIIVKICQKTYEIIKIIGRQYFQNELYVSQWINLYFRHAMKTSTVNNIGAEDTIISLVDNNEKLLEMQITPIIINRIIDLCIAQKRERQLIQLLKAISSCNGIPIANNQNDIVQMLILNDETRTALCMPIKMGSDMATDVLLSIDENGVNHYMCLNHYRKIPVRTYGYLLTIVDLCAEICLGRNQQALRSMLDMYNYDSVKLIVQDETLPNELRALFLRLLLNMHMDQKLESIQIPGQTGVWNDLASFNKDQFVDSEKVTYDIKQSVVDVPQSLAILKKFVIDFLLSTGGVQNIFEVGKNMMTFEILKIIKFMLNHGFYKNLTELKEVSIPMINLMNGANDTYSEQEQKDGAFDPTQNIKRYFSSGNNDIIVESKTLICENLLLISNLEVDGKTMIFLSKFKSDMDIQLLQKTISSNAPKQDKSQSSSEGQPVTKPKGGCFSKVKNKVDETDLNQKKKVPKANQVSLQNQNIQILENIALSYNFESNNKDVYICILFDLFLYKYPQLTKNVFELLVRLFARKRTLLENLQKIQMLENPSSIRILKLVTEYCRQLKMYISKADLWLNTSSEENNKIKIRVIQIFMFFASICKDSKKRKLQDDSEEDVLVDEEEQEDEVLKIASQFQVDLSFTPVDNSKSNIDHQKSNTQNNSEGNERNSKINYKDFILLQIEKNEVMNHENQRLLGSINIETLALFFIRYRIDMNQITDPYYQQLIHSCYKFLVMYIKNNLQNQIKIHNHLQMFLRDIDKNPLICLLIYEMFKNNKRFLTLNVSKILRKIIVSSEEASLQSSKKQLFLKLLEVFCTFEDKLVRPNQQEIVINFTRDVSKNNLIYLFSYEGLPHLQILVENCIPKKLKSVGGNVELIEQVGGGTIQEIQDEKMISVNLSMEIFNVIACIRLLSLCCEGKSDLAEMKCHSEIINLETAYTLYKSSGRNWPFKQAILMYIAHCYLDSANEHLFTPNYVPDNMKPLKDVVKMVCNDLTVIFYEWHNKELDCEIIMPDKSVTSYQKEAQIFAMQSICNFFLALLENTYINCGVDIMPFFSDITLKIAKLYYMTQSKALQGHAMSVLSFINNSDRYSPLLDNVQHPANQNIYIRAQKKKNVHIGPSGQKSSQLSAKLQQLAYSGEMIEQQEREFEDLVMWVTNIEARIDFIMMNNARLTGDTQFHSKSFANVNYEAVISSFMTLLDSKCLEKDQHITGLTLLRKIVEVQNKGMTSPAADWDGEDWEESQQGICERQDALVDIGCIQFLCKHIQEIEDDEILEQTFLVCIALLLGGNPKSQEKFYSFFLHCDPTNILLCKLKIMLIEQFDQTKKFIGEKNAKLQMVYKLKQRQKELDEQKLKLNPPKNQEKPQKQRICCNLFKGKAKEENNQEDQVDPLDEQENADDAQNPDGSCLLNFDNDSDEGGLNPGEEDTIDEMFLVNKIKGQYIQRTIRLLRFLQLLTEGHNSELQNYLREQKQTNGIVNFRSFNFVEYLGQMLCIFEKQYLNCYSCALGMQIIDTLIEIIQGPCKLNQIQLVDAKIIDCCRDLIQQGQQSQIELEIKGFKNEQSIVHHETLKMMSIKLLLSIIEGSVNTEIYKNIADSFDDFKILQIRIEQIYDTFVTEDLNLPIIATVKQVNEQLTKESFQGGIKEGFDIYCLINLLAITIPEVNYNIQDFTEEAAYQFFKQHTGKIEIQKDNDIITIYYPVHPVCTFLSPKTKQHFENTVNRMSTTHKILDFISRTPAFMDEMEHLELRSHDQIRISPENLNDLRDFSTYIAVVINLIVIIYYEYKEETNADGSISYKSYISPGAERTMKYFGYCQLFTSIILMLGFCINKINIILKSGWRNKTELNQVDLAQEIIQLQQLKPPSGDFIIKELPLQSVRTLLLTEGPYQKAFNFGGKNPNLYYKAVQFEYKWICLSFLMQDPDFIFSMIYMLFSFQGLIQSPIFYSCHLCDVINRFEGLQSVILAVTKNGFSILMTAMLGIILVYIYSVFGYTFVADTYYDDTINGGLLNRQGDSICQTMLHCFLTAVNYGLRAGGGIGEFMPTQTAVPENIQGWSFKSVYDMSFFFIIITILLNIIFGIIIDTFAQLREESKLSFIDQKNTCFICGLSKQVFDRETADGFLYHMEQEHNKWHYLYFMIHLQMIDTTELNGTESYIMKLLRNNDIQWFPILQSRTLNIIRFERQEQKQNMILTLESNGEDIQISKASYLQQNIPKKLNNVEQKCFDLIKVFE